MVAPNTNHHHVGPWGAKITIDIGETKGLWHLGSSHCPQIMGLLSMVSLMSSRSDRSGGSQHSQWGRWHQEDRAHMKINLPVFKDEDAKDTVTYQSWRWDLMVYWHAGCRNSTLLPYAVRSLQGYPCELVQSSHTDITLDDVLTILDKHYNNVKALGTLNQELFQLQMADKETASDWGICLSRHFQVLVASFPDCFPLIKWQS